jgi:hypothetical protein
MENTMSNLITEASLDSTREDPTAELLRYHQKFGHNPMKSLYAMARQGTIPRGLRNCPLPVCGSCMYGKATKRPTQTKKKEK